MTTDQVQPGDQVEARDAFGTWREAMAVSGIEGTHAPDPKTGRNRKIHDFPVIWIRWPGASVGERWPWPAEDVRHTEQT